MYFAEVFIFSSYCPKLACLHYSEFIVVKFAIVQSLSFPKLRFAEILHFFSRIKAKDTGTSRLELANVFMSILTQC